MTISKYKLWMSESTSEEKKELAEKAGTSLSLLYQLGYGTRTASPDLAGRIEKASSGINRRARHKPLPDVDRADLAEACANCKFYKGCK